ncbi:MAG TPA: Gfo/Idh/MocA family oxidoreductase [Roseiflexaceae bacterium]|nr:Gfo/Idh/MocA family oxidoreductase [Roseiflexaceae bacterium]
MTESPVRWGVLSTANIGRAAVIPAIHGARNSTLVAVASRDGERARAFADANTIPQAYGSYEALLAADDIDAVYIPLPNSMHKEWVIKAAQAGKHVLCEKPLALDADECMAMEAAANKAGVLLMEAFMYRFHPRTERVQAIVRSGLLGDVKLVRAAFTFRVTNPHNIRFQADLGGGALMDVGCYCVNIGRTLADAEPVEAQAFATWSASGVDEQLLGMLRFPNGMALQFDCALTLARRETYEVVGTDGVLEVPAAFLPGTGDMTITINRGRHGTDVEQISGVDEYQLMVEHFADCILHNHAPRYTASEAAANMRAIEALQRSARNNGRPEQVEN